LLSEVGDRDGEGNITGLNGLLLGVAKKRGIEGVCLLGEVPVYISGLVSPYPKASRSVAEVFGHILECAPDLGRLDAMEAEVKESIEQFYGVIPPDVRGRIDQLKPADDAQKSTPGEITEDDQKRIMQDLEDFFEKGGQES
ncbi:MAG: hypothetical protein FJZ95_07870, partial [Chloroflexi bacterium]|nr:hypothetical protein [Chloroflexota bacterium]